MFRCLFSCLFQCLLLPVLLAAGCKVDVEPRELRFEGEATFVAYRELLSPDTEYDDCASAGNPEPSPRQLVVSGDGPEVTVTFVDICELKARRDGSRVWAKDASCRIFPDGLGAQVDLFERVYSLFELDLASGSVRAATRDRLMTAGPTGPREFLGCSVSNGRVRLVSEN